MSENWRSQESGTTLRTYATRAGLMIVFVALVSFGLWWVASSNNEKSKAATPSGPTTTTLYGKPVGTVKPGQTTTTLGPIPTIPPGKDADGPVEPIQENDRQRSLEAARNFIAAWARPELPAAQWLEGMRPFTNPWYLTKLETGDPGNAPKLSVNGQLTIQESDIFSAIVIVPTTVGDMKVTVQLQSGQPLVSNIEPA